MRTTRVLGQNEAGTFSYYFIGVLSFDEVSESLSVTFRYRVVVLIRIEKACSQRCVKIWILGLVLAATFAHVG